MNVDVDILEGVVPAEGNVPLVPERVAIGLTIAVIEPGSVPSVQIPVSVGDGEVANGGRHVLEIDADPSDVGGANLGGDGVFESGALGNGNKLGAADEKQSEEKLHGRELVWC